MVGRDPPRGARIVKPGDVHPVLYRGADAGVCFTDRAIAAVVGEHLDGLPVMQREEFGHQIADRVLPQVGRDIANPKPAAAEIDRRIPPVGIRCVVALVDRHFNVVLRGCQMQQGVIHQGRHRQRADTRSQHRGADALPRFDDRPFALRHA